MPEFKRGDRVRIKYYDRYAYGEVTIVSNLGIKVLFDGDFDLAYWYYITRFVSQILKAV